MKILTRALFLDFTLESLTFHVIPHRLSHHTSDTIGTNNHISLIRGSIRTMNNDMAWVMVDTDNLLVRYYIILPIPKMFQQYFQERSAGQECNGVAVPELC